MLDRVAIAVTDKVGSFGFFLIILAWTVLWTGYNILASEISALHWRAWPSWLTLDDPSKPFFTPLEINPGEHIVAIYDGDVEVARQTIRLSDGERGKVMFAVLPGHGSKPQSAQTPAPHKKPSRTAVAGAYMCGFGLGFGVVSGIIAWAEASALKNDCPNGRCPSSKKDALDEANAEAMVSTISFGVAGLGAILMLIGSAGPTERSQPERGATAPAGHVRLWTGPQGAGISGVF